VSQIIEMQFGLFTTMTNRCSSVDSSVLTDINSILDYLNDMAKLVGSLTSYWSIRWRTRKAPSYGMRHTISSASTRVTFS